MKYKHLDSIYFLSFMCVKETEKINGIYLGVDGKCRQRPSTYELASMFVLTKWLQCSVSFTLIYIPAHTFIFDILLQT